VPLSNVYYHFRTKEALIEAVIQTHVQELETMFAAWEQRFADPHERLLALLAMGREERNALARDGCPHGSLCQELDKDENSLTRIASHLLQVYLDWTAT
jgi:TetR/AcrR family transcriptional repressor of nem operon